MGSSFRLIGCLAKLRLAQPAMVEPGRLGIPVISAAHGERGQGMVKGMHQISTAAVGRLRLRMDPYLSMMNREDTLDLARAAFTLHQWIAEPDFDQGGEIQRAEALLVCQLHSLPPLIVAAR